MIDLQQRNIEKAAEIIKKSKHLTAFTGAGISVESGIPPFRGEGGLWENYNPEILELTYFLKNPEKSWKVIADIFYGYFGKAIPNKAHFFLSELEKRKILKAVITQNIDNLHQEAGTENVIEYHGNAKKLVCTSCTYSGEIQNFNLQKLPPLCPNCKSVLKPDFIFFGEGISYDANQKSINETKNADVFLLIGTSGVVAPAMYLPIEAKNNGAKIVEINSQPTYFTDKITDLFLKGSAGEISEKILKIM